MHLCITPSLNRLRNTTLNPPRTVPKVSRDGKPKSEGLAALRYLLAPAADIPRTDPMDKFTKASKATKELDKLAFEVMLSIGREELMAWSAKPKSRFDMRDVESGETEGELSHTEAVNARK